MPMPSFEMKREDDDRAWLEFMIISNVNDLRKQVPGHPFVLAIMRALEELPEQQEFDF